MKIEYISIFVIIVFLTSFSAYAAVDYYPLVVYSGEPEGVMAAVSAARNGTETLLIMERKDPGGLMTYGKLNYLDLSYSNDGSILSNRLFNEWHDKVGGSVTFSIDEAINVFNNMISNEKNLIVYRNCELIDVKVNENIIEKLTIVLNNKERIIEAKRFIDASQNAKLAVQANAPYFYGGADIGLPERTMAATLILKLGKINLAELNDDVESNKFGPSYICNKHAWGFIELGRMYKQHHPNIRLRGLNLVLNGNKKNKEAYINGMLIFNVNINTCGEDNLLSPEQAYELGKKEAKLILKYLRGKLGGFENAVLLDFPRELYIRESRHIVSKYQLKTSDLIANRILDDTITLASYPLDYQASHPNYEGFVLFNPEIYSIPFRSLIPCGLKNLLVVGRSAGYSSLTAASARVLPTGMSTGEAAGIAAGISLDNNLLFSEISKRQELIKLLQKKLYINDDLIGYENSIIKDDILLPYINELISWGLVIGGYKNDFRLEDNISEVFFANLLIKGLKRKDAEIFYEWVPGGLTTLSKKQPLSRDRAAMLLLAATSHRLSEINYDDYYNKALKLELIPDIIEKLVKNNRLLTRREAFIIAGNFLLKYNANQELMFFRGENND